MSATSGGRELAVGGAEIAAEDGCDAEGAEETGGDAGAVSGLGAVGVLSMKP